MRVLLDIKDSKVDFVLEMLRNFSFIKAKPLTPYKTKVLQDLKESVAEVNLAKQGKIKLKTAKDLLDEL